MKRAPLALAVIALAGCGSAQVATCDGADALDFGCQERRAVALTRADGPGAALHDLARRMKDSGYVRAACHQLTHRIGRTAGGRDGIAAYADGDPVCGSGYYHGVTEAAMRTAGPRRAATVCTRLRALRDTCIHGMGHGYMHLLRRDMRASLQACDSQREAAERDRCYGGVFMENHADVDHPDAGTLRPREPLYPCTAVAGRYKPACYGRQTSYALFISNGDFRRVFALCARTERAYRDACRQGLGGDVAVETRELEPRAQQATTRRRLCMLAGGAVAAAACVAGAVPMILQDLDGGPGQLDAFCATFESDATQPQHAACLQAGERAYRDLLAGQTGQQAPDVGGLDFICHLKKPGARRRSTQ